VLCWNSKVKVHKIIQETAEIDDQIALTTSSDTKKIILLQEKQIELFLSVLSIDNTGKIERELKNFCISKRTLRNTPSRPHSSLTMIVKSYESNIFLIPLDYYTRLTQKFKFLDPDGRHNLPSSSSSSFISVISSVSVISVVTSGVTSEVISSLVGSSSSSSEATTASRSISFGS